MMNMDRFHALQQRAVVLQDLVQKMADSEYNSKARREILVSGLKQYYRLVKDQETGGRRLYRSAEEMSITREIKEVLNQSWFKRIRGGEKARENKDAPWLSRG